MTKLQRGCLSGSKKTLTTTDLTQQQSNRLFKGKGSSSHSWQPSCTDRCSQSGSNIWHQVRKGNCSCVASQQQEPSVHSTTLLSARRANAAPAPAAITRLCSKVCFPLHPSWSYLLLLILVLPCKLVLSIPNSIIPHHQNSTTNVVHFGRVQLRSKIESVVRIQSLIFVYRANDFVGSGN